MPNRLKYFKRALIGASILSALAAVSPARANTISIELFPTVTPVAGGFFDWSYTATFINSFTQTDESRITIFDFEGYVPGFEVTPLGWTFTTAPTGPALLADAAQLAVPSHTDSNIPNLIWNFTGISGPTADSSTLQFGARSLFGEEILRSYGTRDRADSGIAETNSASQGPTYSPKSHSVPDQSPTLALTGFILFLIGLGRFRSNRKTSVKQ